MEPVGVARSAAAEPIRVPNTADLLVGQVVRARVVRLEGELAYLRWGEHTVAAATHGQLALGQLVSLQVEAAAAGKLVLRLLDEGARGAPGPASSAAERGQARPTASPPSAAPADGGSELDPALFRLADGVAAAPARLAAPIRGTELGGDAAPTSAPAVLTDRRPAGDPNAVNPSDARQPPSAPAPPPGLEPSAGATSAPLPRTAAAPAAAAPTGAPPELPAPGVDNGRDPPLTAPDRPLDLDLALGRGATDGAALGGVRFSAPSAALLLARAALPAYGRVIRGWSEQPPASDPSASEGPRAGPRRAELTGGASLPRAPAPESSAAPRALLAELGLPWDGLTAALVAELTAQGAVLEPRVIRALGQQLLARHGSPADARPVLLLACLGLPPTPRSEELAQRLLRGELDAWSAWRETLAVLHRLARSGESLPAPLRAALRETLAAWSPPSDPQPADLAGWLRRVAQAVGTPPEAKLARWGQIEHGRAELLQDARSQLAQLQHAVEASASGDEAARGALERLRSAIEAEQMLNSAPPHEGAPRQVVLTLPAGGAYQHGGTLELRVQRHTERAGQEDAAPPDLVSLRLELPQLGAVRIRLAVRRPRFACRFIAESTASAALLRGGAGELAERIAQLGYTAPLVDAVCQPAQTRGGALELSVPRQIQRLDIRT